MANIEMGNTYMDTHKHFMHNKHVHKAAPSEGGCCTTRVGCSSITNIGTLQCLWFLVIVHLMQRKPNVSALSHGLLCLSPRRTEGTSLKSIKLGFLLTRTVMMSIHLGTIIAARPPVYMLWGFVSMLYLCSGRSLTTRFSTISLSRCQLSGQEFKMQCNSGVRLEPSTLGSQLVFPMASSESLHIISVSCFF